MMLNMGTGDRIVRAVSGLGLAALPLLDVITGAWAVVAYVVAALLLASGFYLKRSGLFGKRLLDQDMAMSQTALRFLDTIKLAKAHGLQQSFLDRYSEASGRALDQRTIASADAPSCSDA